MKRKGNSKNKGSGYERVICRELSLWFSGGKDDDLFWRTATSGGRATSRFKRGKTTRAGGGDICSTDKKGAPLTKLVTFEIKVGYNHVTVGDLLDRTNTAAQQALESWIQQAMSSAGVAGTFYWMVIHKRDKRQAVVYMPRRFYRAYLEAGNEEFKPLLRLSFICRSKEKTKLKVEIVATTLQEFMDKVPPQFIRDRLRTIKEGKA